MESKGHAIETLETKLQRRFYMCLYALVFLGVILGLSVILEKFSA